jgi:hypothetical protein
MIPSSYAIKQEPMLGEEDFLNPFSMNYASLAGLDVPTTQAYTSPSSQPQVITTNFFSPFHTKSSF